MDRPAHSVRNSPGSTAMTLTPKAATFFPRGFRNAFQRKLAAVTRERHDAAHGSNVDDVTGAPAAHRGEDGLNDGDRAEYVGFELSAYFGHRGLFDRAFEAVARIVDEDIDRADVSFEAVNQSGADQRRWALLNTALFVDGLYLKITKKLATPLVILHVAVGNSHRVGALRHIQQQDTDGGGRARGPRSPRVEPHSSHATLLRHAPIFQPHSRPPDGNALLCSVLIITIAPTSRQFSELSSPRILLSRGFTAVTV